MLSVAAVVGAGLMGRGIAGVLAAGGLEVRIYDANPDITKDAVVAAREVSTALTATTTVAVITGAATLADAVRGADIVTEAVIEDLEVKRDLFAELGALTPDALLTTNTSVLPVTAIAARTPSPERVLGTHWWNPPHLVPVVEVVPGRETSPLSTERGVALLTAIGKTPVVVRRDTPGFIGNRLQHALWREAIALVEEGVCDAETVDLVVRNTIGLRLARMGPLENADFVGLDLTLAIHRAVFPALSRATVPSDELATLVMTGNLGAKTGRGFLRWAPGRRQQAARELAEHVSSQLEGGQR